MFSKWSVFAILVSLTGCSLYEGPPPVRKKEFSQGSLGCLKDFNAQIERYFDGNSSIADVNRLADCSINALRTFGDLVRGEKRDRFTAQEVRNFLQRYFLDDVVFNDSFLQELMRVKQALVGGETTDFTPNDLKEAEGLVNVFREVLLKLHSSMPLSLERAGRETSEYIDVEARAVAEVGEIFGRRITKRDSTYTFDEMGRLFDEVARTFPGAATTLKAIQGYLKVSGILKEILISLESPRESVTAGEWRIIFQEGGQWLGNYLKYVNLKGKYSDWTRGEGRARLSVVMNETFDLLVKVVARHCPKSQTTPRGACQIAPGVPFKLLQEMIESLEWDGVVNGVRFEKSTLRKLVEPFFRHFLSGTDTTETGRAATRVTAEHLERLRTVFREWIDGARYLEGVYAKLSGDAFFPENQMFSTSAITGVSVREILRANGGLNEQAVVVAEGLRLSFSRTIALLDQNSAGAVFDGKNKTRERVYRELVRYTWLRPLLKMAVLGYMKGDEITSREKQVERDGLTRPEFRDMIADYWPLLLDFQLVGPKNSADLDSKSRFREASLFTSVSDGNQVIGIEEGMQLVLYMLSGNPIGTEVHTRATRLCQNGPTDDYGAPSVEPKCYRRKVYDFRTSNRDGEDLWRPFPVLIKFYEGLDEEDQAKFGLNLELAVRKAGMKPEDYFGSDDSESMPMLFHYIEALFLRIDTNGDGVIDRPEAAVGFPVFKNYLSELSGLSIDNPKLASVFYYLLAKGNPPVNDTMGAWKRFWRSAGFFWWHITKPSFKADRLHVLQVFAALTVAPPSPTVGVPSGASP